MFLIQYGLLMGHASITLRKAKDRYQHDIWAVGAAGGTPTIVVDNAGSPTISPDGKTMAFFKEEQNDAKTAPGIRGALSYGYQVRSVQNL